MAVVKNLMVRVGADLSGLVSGFTKGSKAMGGFGKKAKQEAQASAAALGNLKKAMAQGGTNKEIVSLVDKIAEVESGLKAAKAAGFGWGHEAFENDVLLLRDLKTQLNEYVAKFNEDPAGPKEWVAQLREIGVQSQQLDIFVQKLQASVDASQPLGAQLNAAKTALKEMESAGLGAGDAAWDDMYRTVSRLTEEVKSYKSTLSGAGGATDKVRKKTSQVGSAARSASSGVRGLGARFQGIGSKAKASVSGVEKLLRSIRRIGIVSLGLRFVKSIFGELGSVVSEYISENEQLQAQVKSLKSALGQALAPAINVVVNAFSALMPYIVGVSNAIGELIANLFGNGWATVADGATVAAKTTMAATTAQEKYNRSLAGFDQITKLTAQQSGGGGGGASSTTTPITGRVPSWLAEFGNSLKQAIESGDFFGLGELLGKGLSNVIDRIDTYLTGVNWKKLGNSIGNFINGAVSGLNGSESEASLGQTLADFINGIVDVAAGIVETTDWAELGNAISQNVEDCITGIDWGSLARTLVQGLGSIVFALIDGLWDALIESWSGLSFSDLFGDPFKGLEEDLNDLEDLFTSTSFSDFWSKIKAKWQENIDEAAEVSGKLTVDVEGRVTDVSVPKQNGRGGNFAVHTRANVTSVMDARPPEKRYMHFNARLSTWREHFDSKAIRGFTAGLSSWNEAFPNKSISGFLAGLSFWKDSFSNRTIGGFLASLGGWKTAFTNNSIGFVASMTSWKDNLKNKVISLAASITPGWSGSLAKALGIENIFAKLNLKVPKITVKWGTKYGLTYPTGFDIKWNAKGGILNSAAIFGAYGNTLLGGGEAGREAILPLDRNTGWMDKIADRLFRRIVSAQSGSQNITIQLVLDGKVITQTVVRNVNAQARATGVHPMAAYM